LRYAGGCATPYNGKGRGRTGRRPAEAAPAKSERSQSGYIIRARVGRVEPSSRDFCGGGSGSASRMTRRSPFPCMDAGTDGRTRKHDGRNEGQKARGRRRVVFAAVACEPSRLSAPA
jgi:hypothetical protein